MKLARVAGPVVSTICTPVYEGRRLLLCDFVDPSGEPTGGYVLAVDVVGAGAGETVLILDEGNSARQILHREPDGEVRAVVAGIVDEVAMPVDGAD